MKTQIKYQFAPDGSGKLFLTIDGQVIGEVHSVEHAEMIEQKFLEDTEKLHKEIEDLKEDNEYLKHNRYAK